MSALSDRVEDVHFLTAHRSVQEFGPMYMPRLHAIEGVGGKKELVAPVGEVSACATLIPTPVAQQVLHQALCVGKRMCNHRTKFNHPAPRGAD